MHIHIVNNLQGSHHNLNSGLHRIQVPQLSLGEGIKRHRVDPMPGQAEFINHMRYQMAAGGWWETLKETSRRSMILSSNETPTIRRDQYWFFNRNLNDQVIHSLNFRWMPLVCRWAQTVLDLYCSGFGEKGWECLLYCFSFSGLWLLNSVTICIPHVKTSCVLVGNFFMSLVCPIIPHPNSAASTAHQKSLA